VKTLSPVVRTLAAVAIGILVPAASASEIRSQDVRILVGFAAGGTIDAIARVLAPRLREAMDATVIVENKPGAGGLVATNALAASQPDGNVLMIAGVTTIAIESLINKPGAFDPARELVPVALLTEFEYGVAVANRLNVRTLKELVEWMKAHPSEASFGSPGGGSLPHFFGLRFASSAGLDLTHVPFKGGASLVADLIGGHIPLAVSPLTDYIEHHRGGRVRIIATSGAVRSAATPDVATLSEQGYEGGQATLTFAFWAPPNTPPSIVARRNAQIQKVLQMDDVRERLLQLGQRPVASRPDDVLRLLGSETAKWTPVVKTSGYIAER
jgi:tripartite-type tricarboxylate transporter receptor subunit TctC